MARLHRLPFCAALAGALLAAAGAAQAQAKLPNLPLWDGEGTKAPYLFYLGTPANWANVIGKNGRGPTDAGSVKAEPAQVDGKDGIKVSWVGGIGQVYSQAKTANDLADYVDANAALVFDAVVHQPPEDQVTMRVDCRYPCMGVVDMTDFYKKAPLDKKLTVKIPLACFENTGAKFTAVNTPFLIFTTKKFALSMADIRWVPGAAKDDDVVKCPTS